jgi:hypothetical protein
MRKRLQLVLLGLGIATAFPAQAQTTIGVFVNLGITSPRLVQPLNPALANQTRRGDPVVFFDRVVSGPSSEVLLHLSVYADGLVTVSRALFASPGTSVEQADFTRVELEEVTALRDALNKAGAPRLNGLLRGSGILPSFAVTTHVTYFLQNRSLRARPMVATHFSFGADVLDPRAVEVEEILEDFAQDQLSSFFD